MCIDSERKRKKGNFREEEGKSIFFAAVALCVPPSLPSDWLGMELRAYKPIERQLLLEYW